MGRKGKKKKNKNPKLKNKKKANPIKKLDVNDEDFDFTEPIKSTLFILANINIKLNKAFLVKFCTASVHVFFLLSSEFFSQLQLTWLYVFLTEKDLILFIMNVLTCLLRGND